MDKVTREIKRLPDDYRTPSGFKISACYALWIDGKLEQVGSRESLVNIVRLTEREEKIMKLKKLLKVVGITLCVSVIIFVVLLLGAGVWLDLSL